MSCSSTLPLEDSLFRHFRTIVGAGIGLDGLCSSRPSLVPGTTASHTYPAENNLTRDRSEDSQIHSLPTTCSKYQHTPARHPDAAAAEAHPLPRIPSAENHTALEEGAFFLGRDCASAHAQCKTAGDSEVSFNRHFEDRGTPDRRRLFIVDDSLFFFFFFFFLHGSSRSMQTRHMRVCMYRSTRALFPLAYFHMYVRISMTMWGICHTPSNKPSYLDFLEVAGLRRLG